MRSPSKLTDSTGDPAAAMRDRTLVCFGSAAKASER